MKGLICMMLALALAAAPLCGSAGGWRHITVAEGADLRTDCAGDYAASVTAGAQMFDVMTVLGALGEGWTLMERGEYAHSDEYRSAGGDEPWEYKHASVEDETGELWYYDPAVTGERGAEYEAPHMGVLPSESLAATRALMDGAVDAEWLSAPYEVDMVRKRWNFSADRWMTDAEYGDYYRNQKSHYFTFAHLTSEGVPVQGDCVFVNVGVDGLSGLTLNWHELSESDARISPMPLEEAISLADSTRERDTVLYMADLVYSNWLTGSEVYNISWYLCTSNGNYVVDCVLGKHMCDSYEY